MATLKTIKGKEVEHEHKSPDLNAAQIGMARSFMTDLFPKVKEVRPPTKQYNCHGFALAKRHGWVTKPDPFYSDDLTGASFDDPAPGDVVLYMLRSLVTHTAKVKKVKHNKITLLHSKWGEAAEVAHQLEDVPEIYYGKPMTLLRPIVVMSSKLKAAIDTTDAKTFDLQPLDSLAGISERVDERSEFNLMLASTPEVMQRIVESFPARPQPPRFSFLPFAAPGGGWTEDEVGNALAQLSSERVKFKLMLASVDDITARIIASFDEVKLILAAGLKNGAVGAAVLDLFVKKGTQNDDRLTSILLFILSQLPVKEAAGPLFDYLFSQTHPNLNRQLAGQALLKAAGVKA